MVLLRPTAINRIAAKSITIGIYPPVKSIDILDKSGSALLLEPPLVPRKSPIEEPAPVIIELAPFRRLEIKSKGLPLDVLEPLPLDVLEPLLAGAFLVNNAI
jgi:hypothetical protein